MAKKVYRFYSKPDESLIHENDDLDMEDLYPLYAITDKKEYAKQFMEERDMDKFIMRKSKMENDEYVKYANMNNGCILNRYQYIHFPNRYEEGPENIPILSTWFEKDIVQSHLDDQLSEINEDISYDFFPFILSKKYLKALIALEFISFWKMYGDKSKWEGLYTDEEENDLLDYSYPDVTYDELAMFIHLNSETMK